MYSDPFNIGNKSEYLLVQTSCLMGYVLLVLPVDQFGKMAAVENGWKRVEIIGRVGTNPRTSFPHV